MAVTVDEAELKTYMGLSSLTTSLAKSIEIAVLTVTEDLAGTTLSADRKNAIAFLLSAHYVAVGLFKGGLKKEDMGESADTYQDLELGQGLKATVYGQQALALDTSGLIVEKSTPVLSALFRHVSSEA